MHPETPIFATEATIGVMDRMLHNSVSVMNILVRERGIQGYPLYTHDDVDAALVQACAMTFDDEFSLHKDGTVPARFLHAGHVLGSASVLMRFPGHTVFYTGDICASDQEIMTGLVPLEEDERVDTLIIESTYGANGAADSITYHRETERFRNAVSAVLERGGVALVPSFALGRTQEMLNIIARLQDTGRLPDVPVYASGLGRAIYEVYHRFEDYLEPDCQLQPLSRFGRLGDVWRPEVVKGLLTEPAIIVATSGMMIENTPSALIAEQLIQEKHHGIFFVGYLDPETPGCQLLHSKVGDMMRYALGRPAVPRVTEDVLHFNFSAHATRNELREVIRRLHPKNVVFVHGDPDAIDWMYHQAGNGSRTFTMAPGESVTLEA